MSTITSDNIVRKLHAAAENAEKRGFSGELYDTAAREIEELRVQVRRLGEILELLDEEVSHA